MTENQNYHILNKGTKTLNGSKSRETKKAIISYV
jgi:hypothetical protein